MKKIKPLSKQRPLRRWLRRLFGRGPRPSEVLARGIDEMHMLRPQPITPRLLTIEARVSDIDGSVYPVGVLTRAECVARLEHALLAQLKEQVITQGRYRLTVCEDAVNCEKLYRATVTLIIPEEEAKQ